MNTKQTETNVKVNFPLLHYNSQKVSILLPCGYIPSNYHSRVSPLVLSTLTVLNPSVSPLVFYSLTVIIQRHYAWCNTPLVFKFLLSI